METIKTFVLLSVLISLFTSCTTPKNVEKTPLDEALVAPQIIKAKGKYTKGTKPFQGIPSIATTASGKRQILAWYGNTLGEMSGNYIMVAYGNNNKWQNKVDFIVKSPHDDCVRLFDPALWRSPSGDIWLF